MWPLWYVMVLIALNGLVPGVLWDLDGLTRPPGGPDPRKRLKPLTILDGPQRLTA
ncbi:hypothetical protein CYFUS_006747 [Cystobacter fuscus]|uniref:Uncharacterized protein n=1 Tax=Cystobacter fuscus TaxID=43 RepID=A0A250JCT0_9BACT|nr:hypothetical protein CYFUS_006747 [Cystobacter fuscus]